MRTRVLAANHRLLIGEGYATLVGDDIAKFARILRSVGLTLEADAGKPRGVVRLYASRRPVTHECSAAPTPATRAEGR